MARDDATSASARLRATGAFLAEVFREWQADNALSLGAALAYYTLFSLAPLLLLVIAVASVVLGRAVAEGEVLTQLRNVLGGDATKTIEDIIKRTSDSSVAATSVGLITTVLGATSVLGQLEATLNQIWGVRGTSGGGVQHVVLRRLTHLVMILGMGLLLMLSLVVSTALTAVDDLLHQHAPVLAVLLPPLQAAVLLAMTTAAFAVVFKALPDARIAWRDVWLGGFVTALLFALGKGLIAAYLGRATVGSVYGAAGSIVILLLWIYYSSQILLIGAEFTEVYSRRMGSRSGHGLDRGVAPPPRPEEPLPTNVD